MTKTSEAIEGLLEGHTCRNDEAQILSLLALDDELDETVRSLPLRRMFGDFDDRVAGPRNRQKLRDFFSRQRTSDLGPDARARVICALQHGRTCRRDEEAIRDLFLASRGETLTALKNAIDSGIDHRDLQQLVFSDIDEPEVQTAIIDHIAVASTDRPGDDLKILSDIDDTFYCNWKDGRYPKKTVYPGVRQLYLELDLGSDGAGRRGDLVFVSARPRDRLGWVEGATHQTLRAFGLEGATILCGSLRNVHSNASIADRKLQNFVEYAALYPEYRFLFFGDSGQGDATFGRRMREHAPDRVPLVLIHDVVATPEDARADSRRDGVVMFDTYVGAACELLAIGLIDEAAAQRVAVQARHELAEIAFTNAVIARSRQDDLTRDLSRLGLS